MLRRRSHRAGSAEIFADDILRGCARLFACFGGSELNLPISIPIDEHGVVLLEPHGPLDAPRVPAFMKVDQPAADAYSIGIRRSDDGPMIIPGLGQGTLAHLSVLVTRRGLEIGSGSWSVDEDTARALATALLITIGMKLTKAEQAKFSP